jgi:hypothetical protein
VPQLPPKAIGCETTLVTPTAAFAALDIDSSAQHSAHTATIHRPIETSPDFPWFP